jgi:hypothetical protein
VDEDIQKIIKFIRLRHFSLALFQKHVAISAHGLSILSHGATRFATNFLMVARVLDVKEGLKQTMGDVEWNTYVKTLWNTQKKPMQMQTREVKKLLLSDEFEIWQSCANYCTVMKVAVVVLKEFNGKQPWMGNVYVILRALRHHMAALRNAPFNMPGHLVDPLDVAFRKRKALV